jgi:hypothetical protein
MIDHFPHVVSGEMCRCFAHVAAPQATPPIAKSGMRNAECGMRNAVGADNPVIAVDVLFSC